MSRVVLPTVILSIHHRLRSFLCPNFSITLPQTLRIATECQHRLGLLDMFTAFRTPLLLPSHRRTQLIGSWTTSESAISNMDSTDAETSAQLRRANLR